MILTKAEIKILKFTYSHESVSYRVLKKKFSKYPDIHTTLEQLVHYHYLIQIGGSQNNYGEPIPISDTTLFAMDSLGFAEVETRQWFNAEYIVSHIVVPIILAVITTLITLFLTSVLTQFR